MRLCQSYSFQFSQSPLNKLKVSSIIGFRNKLKVSYIIRFRNKLNHVCNQIQNEVQIQNIAPKSKKTNPIH